LTGEVKEKEKEKERERERGRGRGTECGSLIVCNMQNDSLGYLAGYV
jgi:hypothetical protein